MDQTYYTNKCLEETEKRAKAKTPPASRQACASLDDFGVFYGTDKSSLLHNICALYEEYLGKFKDRSFNLYEFGVHEGASLNMWAAFFPKAKIYGVDPNAAPYQERLCLENIALILHDAFDYAEIRKLLLANPPLVIIDDATHYWSHQIKAFETYFPCLLPGGYYIVEDLETSFADFRKGIWADQKEDAFSWFLALAAHVTGQMSRGLHPLTEDSAIESGLVSTVESVTFIKNSALIKKIGL